ncbi:chemotaxis protein CheA [Gilvimarinus sp. SDUM040013]|uniref:Chemotaxis protein CheA n=1 Tax=Gilvimarinus gilvus TaxID=3058038 RepID=A0ABU4RWD3_9GAMM|nr:chemotaxis protein CheA [Gilvimarinus sp. SDUM040013]MDO3388423.1 chemotaxis protein CheA [Gilvimarinus sp. SDUM040013]MDX6847973.1 chemotaxis protein CheA [Gilvimarinus sp. SDUM040013]
MSVDLKQFHQVFFEESREHLDTMEHLLMTLDLESPDAEELNSIFRAAHSIKGGSGIFGFDALGSVTHVMENLLDRVRKEEQFPDTELVDGLLQGVDTLRGLLASYSNDQAIDWDLVARATKDVEALLKDSDSSRREVKSAPYGLYDDPVLPPEPEQNWGLFDGEDVVSDSSVSADRDGGAATEAFGFFEPLDTSGVQNNSDSGTDSAAFGFFEDISEASELSAKASASNSASKAGANATTPAKKPKQNTKPKTTANSKASVESSSIRVDVDKVDKLINLVGELVITQSMLAVLGNELEEQQAEKMQGVLSELERNTREIQESVMSIRMLPVSFVFNRFPRVVRDLSSKLNKEINLEIEGGSTELDKSLIEKLVDPLTHLVRNSIDHGIESSDVRVNSGKSRVGQVILSASQQGGNIVIGIHDDGAGLNRERILSKAEENGIPVSDTMSDEDVWNLIFQPGFSTAEMVTDVSGRGVGMDVVRRNISSLGGRIEVTSVAGEGSVFTIILPLTLAIVDGMGVRVGDQTYIIPLVNIVESMQPPANSIKTIGNDTLLHVRDFYWPVLPLHKKMNVEPDVEDPASSIVVLVETSKKRFGLMVDELAGQQQVVIKSLEQHYRRIPGVAGATIMGDGSVALILDVESLSASVAEPVNMEEIA